ncbi:hypothetical protein GQ600_23876 [Phytophthora cactorum]|nr:hypothetical protein GQ600_23876 [Phytophthora cactorum]
MIVTNDQGNTYGLGNPVKDAFVRQFMRGLKKRKSTEITQRQATPISLDMLRVLHSHLAIAPGFTEASRLWFFAVSAFAFYGMCRINEVLSLKWKNLTLGLARPSTSDPDVSFTYGADKLEGRKTEVAEGRCNYMHQRESNGLLIDDMADVRTNEDGSQLERQRLRFPSAVQNLEERYQDGRLFYCCENARVEWGIHYIAQLVVRDLNRNGVSMRGYIRQQWCDIWFTSYTFRRAGAQPRFMFAPPERRWSLRMVKWWAEWTQNESAETLVRYLLDQAATDEDTQLADCLAPDRDLHVGCPTTFSRRKRNTTEPARQLSSSIEKWLKTVENSVKALEGKIDMLVSIIQPTDQRSQAQHTRTRPERRVQKDINSPTSKGLEGYVPMYWNADAARHLFKHVSEWTSLERKKSGVLPSRLSVAKFIAEDVRDFAIQKGVLSPRNAADSTLSTYAVYYTEHWLKDTAELNVLTIDTLARYIRLDRKRRLWMIVTNDQGNTYGLGNPVKDAFVRSSSRTEEAEKHRDYAAPSDPYFVGHAQSTPLHLAIAPVSRKRVVCGSSLCLRSLSTGCAELMRCSASSGRISPRSGAAEYFRPDVSFTYGADKLEGRKTEVAEGRCNYMHQRESNGLLIDDMADVRTNEDGSQLERQRLRFPSAVQNLEERYQDGRLFYCCENARVEWGKKMSEQAFITLLNLLFEISIVMGCPCVGTFDNNGATSGSPLIPRFMFAPPERRWSLRMVKWWAEWTQNESAETLVRYLLDQAATDEDTNWRTA